jgi:hypothetical protein
MCLAFRRFVNGTQWRKTPREPSAIQTSMQALYERAQTARDVRAEKKRQDKARRRAAKMAARVKVATKTRATRQRKSACESIA